MKRQAVTPILLMTVTGLLNTAALPAQSVTIRVDASRNQGPFDPVWAYFGYDEPNYTYSPNGVKLIGELSALSSSPVHIRTHNLLTTGNGVPALKWGSTNAYTEDLAGKPIYDWRIVDKIIETYLQVGAKPLIEVGFMPKALSTHPDPYRHNFPHGTVFTGWSYPPSNYEKWGELVYRLAEHCVQKYGMSEVIDWDWEIWNEPDIGYWHGTPEGYDELYDYSTAAIRRALPAARVGGPASTGPGNAKAAAFLRQFLDHCSTGKNFVTGKPGAPLNFISFHVKGHPELTEGHVFMGLAHELKDASEGFQIVHSFESFRKLPILLTEADPEGCAACSARTNPQNAYRNGALYSSYEAVAMKALMELAQHEQVNLKGILTWAFEFEDQPYFEGFRTLATNGIDKPVLNMFRMTGLMRGDLTGVESTSAVPIASLLASGVRQQADVDALAVRTANGIAVMIWNYRDEDAPGPAADIALSVRGIPIDAKRVLVQHYRIDATHSNAFTAWKELGSPQNPRAEEYRRLEDAGQLQLLESPKWIDNKASSLELHFTLPLQGLSLVDLRW